MKDHTTFLDEDRAVSPVVGVALLIAIAVILAAVVGAVVLGLGTSSAEAPQASLSFEADNGTLTINHDGGQNLTADNIVLRGDGVDNATFDTDLAAGESFDAGSVTSGDVNVVWLDPQSDDETIIGSTTV